MAKAPKNTMQVGNNAPAIDLGPPREPPAAAVTQTGSGYVTPPRMTSIRRFGMADIEDMGMWLMTRLRERYPHVNDRMFIGWIRGCMESNEFLFIRSENAAGMAIIDHRPLTSAPIVREVFLLSRNDDLMEAAQLYPHIRQWAESMAASEITIECFSDVPHEIVREVIGSRVFIRETMLVKL